MFKTWHGTAEDAATLARNLEAHLNEYAADVVSVSYSVARRHHALAVYRPVDLNSGRGEQQAMAAVEQILDEAQP